MNIHTLKRVGLQALSFALATLAVANASMHALNGLQGAEYKIALATLVAAEAGVLAASWAFWPLLRRVHLPGAAAAAALLAVCLSATLASTGGYVWSKHQARVIVAEAADERRARAEQSVESAETALAPYTLVRDESAIRESLRLCQTKSCRDRLDTELRRSGEKDALVKTLTGAKTELNTALPPMPAEHPFAALLHELFPDAPLQKLDMAVALAALAFLQIAAPLAGLLAGCTSAAPAAAPKKPENRASAAPAAPAAAAPAAAPLAPDAAQPDEQGAETDERTERVVQFVRAAGGAVRTSQRKLAAELGMHPIAVGHAIAACATLGLLVVEASRTGTILRLA